MMRWWDPIIAMTRRIPWSKSIHCVPFSIQSLNEKRLYIVAFMRLAVWSRKIVNKKGSPSADIVNLHYTAPSPRFCYFINLTLEMAEIPYMDRFKSFLWLVKSIPEVGDYRTIHIILLHVWFYLCSWETQFTTIY